MDPVIEVDRLSKMYRVRRVDRAAYRTLREDLAGMVRRFSRRLTGQSDGTGLEEFWALDDVSFQVSQGEVLGIIGSNGAGKSTLLKILGRITKPTRGGATVRGRMGSLLEVGTGFHPELTGRENIFLSGSILGMSHREIRARFDEIVAFAEVERFLDTPVKRYSSGMFVRLGFSVAAHLEPDILLIDEVLAVGDASFQAKCLGKMGAVAHAGRTVLFVSHNMSAVQTLCERVLWIQHGKLVADGTGADVVQRYLSDGVASRSANEWDPESAPGDDRVRLQSVRVAQPDSDSLYLTIRTPFHFVVEFRNLRAGATLNLSLVLYNAEGICVFNTVSQPQETSAGVIRGTCTVPGDLLNAGNYRLDVLIVEDASEVLLRVDQAIVFEIHDVPRDEMWYGKWVGVVHPALDWSVEVLNQTARVQSRQSATE